MKTIILVGMAVLLFFSACKKKSTSPPYYITFNANGVYRSFTGYVGAKNGTLTGYVTVTLSGADSATSVSNLFTLYLDNYNGGAPLVAGQYHDTDTTTTLLVSYTSNGVQYEAGQDEAAAAVANNVTIAHHFILNIKTITTNAISGTFSGDFYANGDVVAGAKISVTNGSFNMLRQ